MESNRSTFEQEKQVVLLGRPSVSDFPASSYDQPVAIYHHQAPVISPSNHRSPQRETRPSFLFSSGLMGLRLPKSCRLLGCANFAKLKGLCPQHFHDQQQEQRTQPLTQQINANASLPPFRFKCSIENILCATKNQVPTVASLHGIPMSSPLQQQYHQQSEHFYNQIHRGRSYRTHTHVNTQASSPAYNQRVQQATRCSSIKKSSNQSGKSQTRAKCRREGCQHVARRKGLCMDHGGRHFCKMEGCTKCAHRGGYCISHGGGRRCAMENCTKSAQAGGICYSHGGGKRCAAEDCTHAARSGGFCIKHAKQMKLQQKQL